MKLFYLVCIALFCASCSGSDDKDQTVKESYEKTKESLKEKELKNPSMFLHIQGDSKKNLVGQTVIKGKISSTATVAAYKDILIKLDFYSKTKALLESDKETIYMELYPGETQKFKTKYFAPKGTDSVSLSILEAKPMQ